MPPELTWDMSYEKMEKNCVTEVRDMQVKITENIKYIGVDDTELDLFESQYVIPEGISYNSYVILDEKVAVMDTVDKRKMTEWESLLLKELGDRKVDYLVVHHVEPDHAGCIERLMELFPEMMLVGNKKTFLYLSQFFEADMEKRKVIVKGGDELSLGEHKLTFYMATMIHWPEVMVSYESKEKVLFSADAFGKFGALELTAKADWACEARRYYFNIVGKYGVAVQALLKKLKEIDIQTICSLHGPVLSGDLREYIRLYDIWSRYEPETKGVLIAYASIHGNTALAAEKLEQQLHEYGEQKVVVRDLARADISEVLEDAFRYDRMVLAAASYDMSVVPCMRDFLLLLQGKNYQKRKVGLLENGTWSPSANRVMREIIGTMKEVEIVEPMVTIRSTLKENDMVALKMLAEALV